MHIIFVNLVVVACVICQRFSGPEFNANSDLSVFQKIPFIVFKTTQPGNVRQKLKLVRNPFYATEIFGELASTTYYVTVRLEDAADFTDVKFFIDMRLQIPTQGRVYNKVFTAQVGRGSTKNVFGNSLSGQAVAGPTQWGSFRDRGSGNSWGGLQNLCGECGFRAPVWTNQQHDFISSFPATMIIIDKDDPGATTFSAGVYIYAGGMLANGISSIGESTNKYLGGDSGGTRAPSRPMIGPGGYFNNNNIEIPLLNPNSKGHKVQTNFRGGFTPAPGTFGNSPHIIGQAIVASNTYTGGSDRGQCFLDLQSIEGNVGTCLKGYPPAIGDIAPAARTPVGDPENGMLVGGASGNFGSGYGFPLIEDENGRSTIYIYGYGGPYRHRGPIVSYFNPETGEIKQIDNSNQGGGTSQVPYADSKYWREGDLIRFYGGSTKNAFEYPVDVNRGSTSSDELNPWYFYPLFDDSGNPTVQSPGCETTICAEHYKRAFHYYVYSPWATGSRAATRFAIRDEEQGELGVGAIGAFNNTWWMPAGSGSSTSSDGNATYTPWNNNIRGFDPQEINPVPNFVGELTFSIT